MVLETNDCTVKDKYGSDAEEEDDEDDSDESTEDEDGEELTPAMDAAILKTLARIKNKDPDIYNSGKNVFEGSTSSMARSNSLTLQQNSERRLQTYGEKPKRRKTRSDLSSGRVDHCLTRTRKTKPLTMKQHALNSVLNPRSRSASPVVPTYAQEQEALRSETIAVFQTAVDESGSEDDLLIPREKTKDEVEVEEEEYRDFLTREVGEDLSQLITVEEGVERIHEEDEGRTRAPDTRKKKDKKSKQPKEETDQEFLMRCAYNLPILS